MDDLYKIIQCLLQQCAREPGSSVGDPHLARQLRSLPRLVPCGSGCVRGERLPLLVNMSLPRFSGRSLTTQLVSQVKKSGRGPGRVWPLDARCWLAASEGDGQVERVLQVCTQAPGFIQVQWLTQHIDKTADVVVYVFLCVFVFFNLSAHTHTHSILHLLQLLFQINSKQ